MDLALNKNVYFFDHTFPYLVGIDLYRCLFIKVFPQNSLFSLGVYFHRLLYILGSWVHCIQCLAFIIFHSVKKKSYPAGAQEADQYFLPHGKNMKIYCFMRLYLFLDDILVPCPLCCDKAIVWKGEFRIEQIFLFPGTHREDFLLPFVL